MQAIEFEAVAKQRMLRIPDTVPDGAKLRVLLLLEDTPPTLAKKRQPSPNLAGTVTMKDDLIAPAIPAEEWEVLR
ncbi:MAG: hypothetical protein U5J62_09505 [Desulfurivibrio sp.]|nr:hypothetical protein [Desulfurivibrio sp.]